MKQIDVAVYVHKNPKKRIGYEVHAYTYWCSSEWPGYNKVSVIAENGTKAKQKAKRLIKRRLQSGDDSINVGDAVPWMT